jgi:hypothetical protein
VRSVETTTSIGGRGGSLEVASLRCLTSQVRCALVVDLKPAMTDRYQAYTERPQGRLREGAQMWQFAWTEFYG